MRLQKVLLLFLVAVCATAGLRVARPAPTAAQDITPAPVELRVMTFNIWLGGALIDFYQVVAAIEAADADIVGIQEAEGNLPRLAAALGWHYNERLNVISRFPLIDPPGADGYYIFAQINVGQVVAVTNVHLPSGPEGNYAVRDGAPLEEVLQLERDARLSEMQPFLDAVAPLIEQGMPVLLTGDFNAPSHRDWTEALVGTRTGLLYAVPWPVSRAVEDAGFIDTYRAVYPDPAQRLGITWTYGYPYPRLNANEVLDRIDIVYAANIDGVSASQIVGPAGSPEADIELDPYPSDHRAVVSTLSLTPVVPPVFVAAERRVEQGDAFLVWYHAPNGEVAGDRLAIIAADGDPAAPLMWLPPHEAGFFGSVQFGSGTLTPGLYRALLQDAEANLLSQYDFWVVARDAVPALTTDKPIYAAGEPIVVAWQNAPAARFDWVGIFAVGDPDLYNNYWAFEYTKSAPHGRVTFDADDLGAEMLPAGDYEARLFLDDGYAVLATTFFTVTE